MRIEKRSYSSNPWRLVDDSGEEIYLPMRFDHPTLGTTTINGPVCGKTKAEVVQLSLKLLEKIAKENAKLRAQLKAVTPIAKE